MAPQQEDASPSGSTLASRKSNEDTPKGNNSAAGTSANGSSGASGNDQKQDAAKKDNFVVAKAKALWKFLALDPPSLMSMFKAAAAPTIALSFYQATKVAHYFTTLGYLVAIASILAMPIMPRAKFLQNLILNTFAICLSAAISVLALWSSVQARHHTAPNAPLTDFNSSQAAVCAIWLIFQVYVINSIKSARPQFTFPCVLASIFAVVAMTYGPSFPTMPMVESFVKRLLMAFIAGFAIAFGVNIFVFPVSSRKVVFKEMTGYIMSFRKILKAQTNYFQSLETVDMFRDKVPAAAALKGAVGGLKALHGKMSMDLPFAKRDFDWGNLDASNIGEIATRLRLIMLPLVGMTTLVDVLERVATQQGYKEKVEDDPHLEELEQKAVEEYHLLLRSLHEPFAGITAAMDEALEHVLLTLKFKKAAKSEKDKGKSQGSDEDVEAKAAMVKPGDAGFSKYFSQKIDEFYATREKSLKDWCIEKGIAPPESELRDQSDWNKALELVDTVTRRRTQRELFIALHMEYMQWATAKAILDLVDYADGKVADGTMTKRRLILPGKRRMVKWVRSAFGAEATSHEDVGALDHGAAQSGPGELSFGSAYSGRKDPEHLPAKNSWQKFGNGLRKIPKALRSPQSVFGFRVACALMSVCIVAFLRDTHLFFLEQRLFWSAIMIAISMNRLAGQSVFNFSVRVVGTIIATIATFIIWYIVDGKTAGVLVFEFVWCFCCFWIVLKRPRFVVVGIISSVTSVLVVGYELQVRKIGVQVAISNYQLYYPIYELAPYRLACVAGGLFVGFIWTIIPYPISENSELRKDLGRCVYALATHYTLVHETVKSRIRGDEGDPADPNSPGSRLSKARLKIFGKEMLLIQTMKTNLGFQKWQVEIGGKFPKATYSALVNRAEDMLNWITLISFASGTMAVKDGRPDSWQQDFRRLLSSVQTTSEQVSSRLALLSNSITNGSPLPPYLRPLEHFNLDDRLSTVDKDILSINNIAEPGYAAFAVMQTASRHIVYDLNKLTEDVKQLVGELDFSFHFVDAVNSQNSSQAELSNDRNKQD